MLKTYQNNVAHAKRELDEASALEDEAVERLRDTAVDANGWTRRGYRSDYEARKIAYEQCIEPTRRQVAAREAYEKAKKELEEVQKARGLPDVA